MAHARGLILPRRWRSAALLLALLAAPLAALFPGGAPASAAQEAPRPVCVPGDTVGARIDAIIAILIGLAKAPDDTAGDGGQNRCAGVFVLTYLEGNNFGSWLGMDKEEIWDRYRGGDSLAAIAETRGVDRAAAIAGLQEIYTMALDRALAAGAIDDRQRQSIADRILPQFGWLVDWEIDDPLQVAGGDVNLDGAADIITSCMPGADETAQTDNLVRFVLGLTVDGLAGNDVLMATDCSALGVIGQPGFPVVLTSILAPDEFFQRYLSGESLSEVIRDLRGAAFLDGLYRDLKGMIAETVADKVPAADREVVEQQAFLIIVITLKHHGGDPLPNDFSNTTLDDAASAAVPEAAALAAPDCHGQTATIFAATTPANLVGTNGDDVIVGSSGADSIWGEGGDDLICGEGGDDYLNGNQGKDEIYGGNGDDEICGELCYVAVTGNDDILHGGNGDDDLYGQIGGDTLYGDHGNDDLYGSDGGDDLYGGDHDDFLDGGTGTDTCTGGSGNNTFSRC